MRERLFATPLFRRTGRRRLIVAAVVLTVLASGLYGIIELQRRYRIADIVTDEAEWDLKDTQSPVSISQN